MSILAQLLGFIVIFYSYFFTVAPMIIFFCNRRALYKFEMMMMMMTPHRIGKKIPCRISVPLHFRLRAFVCLSAG